MHLSLLRLHHRIRTEANNQKQESLTRGINPRRCAINLPSHRTVEFSTTSTRSIATVGTSAIATRRTVLATLKQVFESVKFHKIAISITNNYSWSILH